MWPAMCPKESRHSLPHFAHSDSVPRALPQTGASSGHFSDRWGVVEVTPSEPRLICSSVAVGADGPEAAVLGGGLRIHAEARTPRSD